jgi:hypothetical protein
MLIAVIDDFKNHVRMLNGFHRRYRRGIFCGKMKVEKPPKSVSLAGICESVTIHHRSDRIDDIKSTAINDACDGEKIAMVLAQAELN